MRQLVFNSVQCTSCNEVLVSHHRHDYKTCGCNNQTMVDGGTAYSRYGGIDLKKVRNLSVYDDDPFEEIREHAERGGRGKDGTEPLTWIKLKDINDEWLNAIVDYGGPEWHINLIKKEIKYREDERNNSERT
jgi:hypothetical protein